MRALTVKPGHAASARLESQPEPEIEEGEVLVETLLLGICGTDAHVLRRRPSESRRMILGHESLGRVVATRSPYGPSVGDLVVGVIRRPCGHCKACEDDALEWCKSDPPIERGIYGLDGFGADYWSSAPEYLVGVPPVLGELGVLIEPASSVARGLRRVGATQPWGSGSALVLGAGPIGLLASAFLHGFGWTVRLSDPYGKPGRVRLAERLGAHCGEPSAADLVVEASGTAAALSTGFGSLARGGRLLVLGLAEEAALMSPAPLVMGNAEVTFSVNASREDHERAGRWLAGLDQEVLAGAIGRELPPERFADALTPDPETVKTVLRFGT